MKLTQMESKGRLFVLCNDKFKDNPVYACVQGGHAVAQYFIDNGENDNIWKNDTIVYLWYPEKYFKNIKISRLPIYEWYEPDQGNILTAAAIWENDIINSGNESIMKIIKKLQLVK